MQAPLKKVPRLAGNLSKKANTGMFHSWQSRFFVANNNHLSYYNSEKAYKQGSDPKRSVCLADVRGYPADLRTPCTPALL